MRSALVASLALVAALLQTDAALGHAAPERFDPGPGAVLEEAPARVDGWFTQEIRRTDESFIQVLDSQGNAVSVSSIVDDADRRHMYAELQPSLGPGRYLVAYQTFSDEDLEVSGACFLFFVGQEAADRAHDEKVEIGSPEECPVEAEEENGEAAALKERVQELETTIAEVQDEDGDVPLAALIGAAVGSGAAMLLAGGVLGLALGKRRQ